MWKFVLHTKVVFAKMLGKVLDPGFKGYAAPTCEIKCKKPFPKPERFPVAKPEGNLKGREKSQGRGDGFPNTSRVLVENGHSIIINLSIVSVKINPSLLMMKEWEIHPPRLKSWGGGFSSTIEISQYLPRFVGAWIQYLPCLGGLQKHCHPSINSICDSCGVFNTLLYFHISALIWRL